MVPQDDIHCARKAPRRDLIRALLHPDPLPVYKGALLSDERPMIPVPTGGVGADAGRGEAELLLNVADERIALLAAEDCEIKLWTDLARPGNRATEGNKLSEVIRTKYTQLFKVSVVVQGNPKLSLPSVVVFDVVGEVFPDEVLHRLPKMYFEAIKVSRNVLSKVRLVLFNLLEIDFQVALISLEHHFHTSDVKAPSALSSSTTTGRHLQRLICCVSIKIKVLQEICELQSSFLRELSSVSKRFCHSFAVQKGIHAGKYSK
mmetsp:Transcript_23429/g.56068  ORF Transcript_23429/g.56068 Transcript_23429/m.56068 type:complete len:261 (-) Transcript_23429:95-877(-)